MITGNYMSNLNNDGFHIPLINNLSEMPNKLGVLDNDGRLNQALPVGAVVYSTNYIGNSGSSKTIDWSRYNLQKITISANCTLTFTAPIILTDLILIITNGGNYDITWPTVSWAGSVSPTLTTDGTDIINFIWDGTGYWGAVSYDHG